METLNFIEHEHSTQQLILILIYGIEYSWEIYDLLKPVFNADNLTFTFGVENWIASKNVTK